MTGTTIAGIVIIVFGAGLFGSVAWLYLFARSSVRWSETQGRILTATLGGDYVSSDVASARQYRVLVTYEYEVGGRTFTGDRIQFGDSLFAWHWASSRHPARVGYRPDQTIAVYYDPAHPHHCTLSRVIPHWWFQQLLVVAAIFVLAGIGVLTGHVSVVY
jgi:hypothetical protein